MRRVNGDPHVRHIGVPAEEHETEQETREPRSAWRSW